MARTPPSGTPGRPVAGLARAHGHLVPAHAWRFRGCAGGRTCAAVPPSTPGPARDRAPMSLRTRVAPGRPQPSLREHPDTHLPAAMTSYHDRIMFRLVPVAAASRSLAASAVHAR